VKPKGMQESFVLEFYSLLGCRDDQSKGWKHSTFVQCDLTFGLSNMHSFWDHVVC